MYDKNQAPAMQATVAHRRRRRLRPWLQAKCSSSQATGDWAALPCDCLQQVLLLLPLRDRVAAASVCKVGGTLCVGAWRLLALDELGGVPATDAVWQSLESAKLAAAVCADRRAAQLLGERQS